MFSSFWYSPYGYNPLGNYRGTSNAYPFVIGDGSSGCYNSAVPGSSLTAQTTCPTDEALLNYITNLEVNRKLDDLSNVELGRAPEPNDCLVYDYLTGKWTLTNYISGGAF